MRLEYLGIFSLLLSTGTACAQAPAIYHVDFDNGSDTNDGRSPQRPWKHAPGDSRATAAPASKKLAPGDTVRFKAGVRYRGSIAIRSSGTQEQPITYIGSGWGNGAAIIDGADPVLSVEPCPDASACGGAPNWQSLQLVRFKAPPSKFTKLYDTTGQLFLSQYPLPADPFNHDNRDEYVQTAVSDAEDLAAGFLENAELAEVARGGGDHQSLAIWHRPNLVTRRKITSISGDTIRFQGGDMKPYTDRPGAAAVAGSPRLLTRPGTYALISDTSAVVYPRPDGGELAVGNGRSGFNTWAHSHIVITGFQFANGTAAWNERRNGLAIYNTGNGVSRNLVIANNIFGPAALVSGSGILAPGAVEYLLVRGNRFDRIEYGSGIRFGNNTTNIRIIGNQFSRFGRTGLYMGGVRNAEVRGNIISDVVSVHGNGMSFYLRNQNILVENNCIYGSFRPLTFNGAKGEVRNNLTIRNNIFISTPDARAAISGWGGSADGIMIENNIALGGDRGVLLHRGDKNVTVVGNLMTKLAAPRSIPSGWVLKDNKEVSFSAAREARLSPARCSMEGRSGPIVVDVIASARSAAD